MQGFPYHGSIHTPIFPHHERGRPRFVVLTQAASREGRPRSHHEGGGATGHKGYDDGIRALSWAQISGMPSIPKPSMDASKSPETSPPPRHQAQRMCKVFPIMAPSTPPSSPITKGEGVPVGMRGSPDRGQTLCYRALMAIGGEFRDEVLRPDRGQTLNRSVLLAVGRSM